MLAFQHAFVLPAAFALLPPALDTPAARAMVLAIGLHETEYAHRRQLAGGPARGFHQFELSGGVAGVLTHPVTRPLLERVLEELRYVPAAHAVYEALEHNDVLDAVCARLLLYTMPGALPTKLQVDKAWSLYLGAWKPGAAKRDYEALRAKWAERSFPRAWALVDEARS